MAKVQRKTDANSGGGTITDTKTNTNVFANGLLISINGSTVSNHGTHTGVITANGSTKVFIHGIGVNRTGDADSCGDTRSGGSTNVFVG